MTRPLLELSDVTVTYAGGAIEALTHIDISVSDGAIVAILGPNGAGKTTLARAVTGLLGMNGGQMREGRIRFGDRDVSGTEPSAIVRAGISQVMEGRRIFADLTIDENLRAASYTVDKEARQAGYERVRELFPFLADRRSMKAGYLSGGEQQMLAIGRALMQSPDLLLLDEPSLGLAPLIVEQVRDLVQEINALGTTVLLIEQNAGMALSISGYGYILSQGRVVKEGTSERLLSDPEVRKLYLGVEVSSSGEPGGTEAAPRVGGGSDD